MTPEMLNKWRALPRLLVLLYGALVWNVCEWYMTLPDPTTEQSAFAGSIVVGAAGWFKFYVESGPRD